MGLCELEASLQYILRLYLKTKIVKEVLLIPLFWESMSGGFLGEPESELYNG